MLQIVLPPPAAIAKNVTALAQWQSHFVARTQCTIQDDLMGQDNFFNTRKSDHFHSLKFYKQDTIELIVSELKHHICHFKYDLLLKPFNVTVDCSEKLK